MIETGKEIVTQTALKDDVLALLVVMLVVGFGLLLWGLWKAVGKPFRDAGVKYLDRQAEAMERQAEAMRGLHEEFKELRKDLGG